MDNRERVREIRCQRDLIIYIYIYIYPAETLTDTVYADDLAVLANTPDQADIYIYISKLADCSRVQPECSLFNTYYTGM